MKKEKKEGTQKKRKGHRKKDWRKKERERTKRLKKYNNKEEEFSILSHSTKACPRILSVYVRV